LHYNFSLPSEQGVLVQLFAWVDFFKTNNMNKEKKLIDIEKRGFTIEPPHKKAVLMVKKKEKKYFKSIHEAHKELFGY